MVQTVIKENYGAEILKFTTDLSDNKQTFEIYAQTVDRSYESRSVYFNFGSKGNTICGWLNGEDSIKLGQTLIEHGTKALTANRINHQHIHRYRELKQYMAEGRVAGLIMTVIDEHPANYGGGFRMYQVKPIWEIDKAPKYSEDFEMETVIYWSPFDKEYQKQIKSWGGNILFRGYNRAEELAKFKRACEDFSKPAVENKTEEVAKESECCENQKCGCTFDE